MLTSLNGTEILQVYGSSKLLSTKLIANYTLTGNSGFHLSPANGGSYNIFPSGGDDTKNINSALQATTPGSVFNFAPGVYTISSLSPETAAININIPITLVGNGATITTGNSTVIGPRLFQIGAVNVTIQGFQFAPSILQDLTCIYVLSGSNNLTICNNIFNNPQSGATYISAAINNFLFTGNQVIGKGYGILNNSIAGGFGFVVSNNTFTGLGTGDSDAIEFNCLDNPIQQVTISSNTISNYVNSIASAGFGIGLSFVQGGIVIGNVITNCSRSGIHIEHFSTDIIVSSNFVSQTQCGGIEIQCETGALCSRITVSDNILYQNCTLPAYNLGRGAIDAGVSVDGTGYGCPSLKITDNTISFSGASGIYAYQAFFAIIKGNKVVDSSVYGISGTSLNECIIAENICTDDQGNKTQIYGLHLAGGMDTTGMVVFNNFIGNLTGGVSDTTTGACYIGNAGAESKNSLGLEGGTRFLGFYGLATPISKPSITGSKGANAALTNLLSQLAALGLVTDSTT